jgi:fructosamine-3-kinase
VAEFAGIAEERVERLSGGDLSEVLRVHRPDGSTLVAKHSAHVGTEAAMLRALLGAEVPAPRVETELSDILLLEDVPNDAVFSRSAWADIGSVVRKLHDRSAERYGWPSDYALGSVSLDNREGSDWLRFWGEQRLVATASVLDRPWRERIDRLAARLGEFLPSDPPAVLLHGDLWNGNILVREGRVAALIDPACYYGDREVDLAMLTLFGEPSASFWEAYGPLDAGWAERQPIYQLFPALVHLRLFGATYGGMVDRLLLACGA